ncbi:MAG: holo-ACP synthase [Candidatus Margulisbacteria bacterium]|nr:holo-ACP synthase [Candidatus Margulisiibacteriota bacterium]
MIGVDIIEINRIENAFKLQGQKFLDRIYTSQELEYCRYAGKYNFASLAVRFAAKEAVAKAFGTGVRGFTWMDIEVIKDNLGKPSVLLHGKAKELASQQKIKHIHISLSHNHHSAVASAFLEK